MVSFFSSFKYSRLVSVSYGCNFKVCHPDVCVTNEREESVVNQHNIFLNKLCWLTTLFLPLISYKCIFSEVPFEMPFTVTLYTHEKYLSIIFLQATCVRCVVVCHHFIQGKKKILVTTARNVTDTE